MRLLRFNYTIEHVPGKSLQTADTLSRAPLPHRGKDQDILREEIEHYAQAIIATDVPDRQLERVRKAQNQDPVAQTIRQYIQEGWPKYPKDIPVELRAYEEHRALLAEDPSGIIVHGTRVYIPRCLREEVLQRIHQGHLGEKKCQERAKRVIWWPGMLNAIKKQCSQCEICQQHRPQPVETLIMTPPPNRPWQKVAVDLCERSGKHYLVMVDYFSRYPEVIYLRSTTAAHVINKMEDIFGRHGIPEVVRSDNGPQFDSQEYRDFARKRGFRIITSSPRYPKSNGQAEAAVKN
ncbi:PREDICTED: uncharacterized protein K02A2.6-like [Wasmannia auropunctata]|uniref:uncharacterized protein K02A2.6-like n=1 Tax=Wasmannia auropunctata TaxID=64793 RepID=UPI0005EE2B89|nr:PREDICTED: uncharacterized protein K02A2.6-like [Wasmannia auropunctata]